MKQQKEIEIYKKAMEQADVVPYEISYSLDQKEEKFEFIGDGILHLIGYTSEELTKDRNLWRSCILEIDLSQYIGLKEEQAIKRARKEEIKWHAYIRIKKRNGEECWLLDSAVQRHDDSGKIIGSLGTLQDFTSRKRFEDIQKGKQELYHRAIIQADAVPYLIDYGDGKFGNEELSWIGEEIIHLTGYSSHEFNIKIWRKLIQKEIPQGAAAGLTIQEAAQRARNQKIQQWWVDVQIKTKKGEIRWLSDSAIQREGKDGHTIGAFGVLQDITKRKKAEEELKKSEKKIKSFIGLQSIIQQLASGFNLIQILQEIVDSVLRILEADNVILYQYHLETDRFDVPPIMAGKFLNPHEMRDRLSSNDTVIRKMIDQKSNIHYISNINSDRLFSKRKGKIKYGKRFTEREKIDSCVILKLLGGRGDEVLGLLFVNYRRPIKFKTEEKKIIEGLASSAGIALHIARLFDRINNLLIRREKEHEALQQVNSVIVNSVQDTDFDGVLDLILHKAMNIIRTNSGRIMWYNQTDDILELKVSRNYPRTPSTRKQKLGEGIVGIAAKSKKSVLVSQVTSRKWESIYQGGRKDTQSVLAVPLIHDQKLLGVLEFEHEEIGFFSEDDKSLLEKFALQAVIAVNSVELYKKLESQRLETWKEFTSRIAHIIGTRIGVIEGNTSILSAYLERNCDQNTQVYLNRLTDSISKAQKVLHDFRFFSNPQELNIVQLDLKKLVDAILDEIRPGLKFPIEFCSHIEHIKINCDELKLSHAIMELIENAQQALIAEGNKQDLKITMNLDLCSAKGKDETFARVLVCDNGKGIDDSRKDLIFEPYSSSKGRGNGLGLAIVKKIIEDHNGEIEEIGKFRHGAKFKILLPTSP